MFEIRDLLNNIILIQGLHISYLRPSKSDICFVSFSVSIKPFFGKYSLFGSDELKQRVGRECFDGDKRICLAISEPFAGSDVANITMSITRSWRTDHPTVDCLR